MHLAKDVLNKAKYDIIIQTIEIPQCTSSTLRYSEMRHICLIYYPLKHSISMPTIIKIDKPQLFECFKLLEIRILAIIGVIACYKFTFKFELEVF